MRKLLRLISRVFQALLSPITTFRYLAFRCGCVMDGKINVPFMVLITGQKCTLRCRDCSNFTPYLPQEHYDLEAICGDFEKIARVARIWNLQIQGGEALLYPGLVKLLECVQGSARNITVATNGTKLLSPEQIDILRTVRARVRVSDYNISQQRSMELIEQCRANGIDSALYRFARGSGSWIDLGGSGIKENDEAETDIAFESCPFKGCLTLEDGILAHCSRATVSHNVQSFAPAESDFVNVRFLDSKKLSGSLYRYIRQPASMTACRYCRGGKGPEIPPAIQIER